MNVRIGLPIRLVLLLAIAWVGVSFGDEPPAHAPKEDAPVATDAVPVKDADKQAGVEAKPATEAGKDQPAAGDAKADSKPVKKDRAARAKAAKPAGLDAVAAPIRALFGGAAEAPAMVAQPAAQPAVEELADNDPMVLQYTQQIRPVYSAELSFIRLICGDLAPEQRLKVKAAAEAALKQAAKQIANQQNRMQRGIAVQTQGFEPGKAIREAIAKSLKELLTEEQMERYSDEAAKRAGDRKRATILCVVGRLDGLLYLTADQREKIEKILTLRWQDGWERWLQIMTMYGDRYYPQIPDDCVTPHLNPEQRSVWAGLQKIDIGWWWGGQQGQIQNDDGWWGKEEANADAPNNGAVIGVQVIGF